jgi:hypothetical protein
MTHYSKKIQKVVLPKDGISNESTNLVFFLIVGIYFALSRKNNPVNHASFSTSKYHL